MKNKKTIGLAALGVAVLFLIFAWLFWGSQVPEPTDKTKQANSGVTKPTVHDTVLDRNANGKKLWAVKVGEATQESADVVTAKDLDGVIYLNNGDEMYVKAKAGKMLTKTNVFELSEGVTARMKNGGFLKADKVEWNQTKDIITATGAVKVVKDDMLAQAEKIVTSSKLKHFKLNKKAHVERGGHYEEK